MEILAYENSSLGLLCLRRRELLSEPGKFITEMTLNHEFLMSSYNTRSEQALADIALDRHRGDNLEVLVGGLGLGYTAHAALQPEKVSHVRVIEFLAPVISWIESELVPLSNELKSHPKLEIQQGDVYELLLGEPERKYDVVLIDVDHSPQEHLSLETPKETFYSASGLKRAKEHLAPGAVLGVWSYAESSPFVEALKNVFKDVQVKEISFQNKLSNKTETDWLFFARD